MNETIKENAVKTVMFDLSQFFPKAEASDLRNIAERFVKDKSEEELKNIKPFSK